MPNNYAAVTPKKFLDADGLAYFARKLNQYPTNDVLVAVIDGVQDALEEKIDNSNIGLANGIASLDTQGKVPIIQLPESVNEIEEYADYSLFPLEGTAGRLYVDQTSNGIYRWGGTSYVSLSGGGSVSPITASEIDALF